MNHLFYIYISLFFLTLFNVPVFYSQQLLYSNIINGGVTANGTISALSSLTKNFSIDIPPNCSIEKAFLISGRDSLADDITVTLNGKNYTFNDGTIITNGFNALINGNLSRGNSSMHAIDITSDIDSSINNYTIFIPLQTNTAKGNYSMFYLYVVFKNINMPKVSCNLYLNNQNAEGVINYLLANINPIDTSSPVCLGIINNYACDTTQDGSYVFVDGNNIGLIGGNDSSSIVWCSGVLASYSHYNNNIFGLLDDSPDSLMNGPDALANVSHYISNGATNVTLAFDYQTPSFIPGLTTNPIKAAMLSYDTPCDFITSSVNFKDTTICEGDSIQMEIHGLPQYTYSWYYQSNLISTDSILKLAVQNSSLYNIWIRDTNGCIKTENIKVNINSNPTIDSIVVTPTLCADSTGTIEVVGATGGTPVFGTTYYYSINGVNNTNLAPTYRKFIHLDSGEYIIRVTDDIGCYFEDTVQLNEYIDVNASFSASVTSGEYPLTVDFNNLSNNADGYYWYLPHDTLTTTNVSTVFDTTGIYTVELIAWQNEPRCADTTTKTINVKAPFKVTVPSVFNAHTGPFSVYAYGTKEIDFTVFNSIGQLVYQASVNITDGQNTIWSNTDVSQGIYHYRMTATGVNGDKQSKSGKILVIK